MRPRGCGKITELCWEAYIWCYFVMILYTLELIAHFGVKIFTIHINQEKVLLYKNILSPVSFIAFRVLINKLMYSYYYCK